MKLTSLLCHILKNVNTNVSLSFWLEGDEYTIKLKPSSQATYEDMAPCFSISTQDTYKNAKIVELWAPRRFFLYYIDETEDIWFELNLLRNNEPIRLYGRGRLFFNH